MKPKTARIADGFPRERLTIIPSTVVRRAQDYVAEIGGAPGHDDPLCFSRLFRQKIGQPPTRYRRAQLAAGR
jgi:transcriptional regulator GlxA family with amidase domain